MFKQFCSSNTRFEWICKYLSTELYNSLLWRSFNKLSISLHCINLFLNEHGYPFLLFFQPIVLMNYSLGSQTPALSVADHFGGRCARRWGAGKAHRTWLVTRGEIQRCQWTGLNLVAVDGGGWNVWFGGGMFAVRFGRSRRRFQFEWFSEKM